MVSSKSVIASQNCDYAISNLESLLPEIMKMSIQFEI